MPKVEIEQDQKGNVFMAFRPRFDLSEKQENFEETRMLITRVSHKLRIKGGYQSLPSQTDIDECEEEMTPIFGSEATAKIIEAFQNLRVGAKFLFKSKGITEKAGFKLEQVIYPKGQR